jgi:hypothetical protein
LSIPIFSLVVPSRALTLDFSRTHRQRVFRAAAPDAPLDANAMVVRRRLSFALKDATAARDANLP